MSIECDPERVLGAPDGPARSPVAKRRAIGQPVIIANRAGAAETTAAASVAKSDPDGYTLLLNTIATHRIGPHLHANLRYDRAKDFAPVILPARFPLITAVTASLPARSVECARVLREWCGVSSETGAALPHLQALPQHEGEEAHEDVGLNAILALMPDRTHAELIFLDRGSG
jgi:Tripartite tricarboxylate transporter family receptor